ncbi:helix-turn-helix domain-containing protein [Nocardioides sp. NBC_00850]|uniref:helix-turn-helix domain-containing protein n=1 Tax=Nocardioides sp. NBC_00850 TaxID=2976001 RepID=UPI00386E3ECB|nr:helix-turn-helix domain-containing protein [Nocardioides sp. NBC_00850]
MRTASAPRSGRPSGLAAVGYGMTAVGFVQVAVTIAPQVAQMIPAAGSAAPAVGVAVALAADVVWAALGHTTIQAYKSGQRAAAYGFGAATAVAVAVSTVLLAAVGHMGPWSAIPALAALLLVADGIRDQVTVSAETAAIIRARTAEIRDQRALATIEARHEAHMETITGYRESARLAARTHALAEIKVTVERAENKAARRLTTSAEKHAAGAIAYRELLGRQSNAGPDTNPDNGADTEGDTDPDNQSHAIIAPADAVTPDVSAAPALIVIPDTHDIEDDDADDGLCAICATDLGEEDGNHVHPACAALELRRVMSVPEVAELLGVTERTVYRWTKEANRDDVA